MATKYYSAQDLMRIPLRGLRLENLAAPPDTPQPGETYFDTVLGHARFYNGTSWEDLGLTIADGSLALSKLATDPLARANHTGTQLAATISDLGSTVHTILGAAPLDDLADPAADVSFANHKATNLADPTTDQDAVNQRYLISYVASRVNGLDWKASVRVMSSTNVNIASGPGSIDGVTLSPGDRVLLTGQSTGSENGIYGFGGSGSAMVRTLDADASAEVTGGLTVFVNDGTTYHDTIWSLSTNDAITLDTTALTFTQIGAGTAYSASSPVTLTGSTFGLTTVPVATGGTSSTTAAGARTNLGVAQKGFASDVGAMTAGVGLAIAHGLGTDDVVVMVRNKSTGAMVLLDTTVDATNITLTSAVAVSSGVLRVTAVPVV